MEFVIKHFNELSTTELYEILKTRAKIFVVEQAAYIRILMIRTRMRFMYFAGMMPAELQGASESFGKIMTRQQA